jgi:hypothetical protein
MKVFGISFTYESNQWMSQHEKHFDQKHSYCAQKFC